MKTRPDRVRVGGRGAPERRGGVARGGVANRPPSPVRGRPTSPAARSSPTPVRSIPPAAPIETR